MPLAVWVSFVASMCAYKTEDWEFFVGCLRDVCRVAELREWSVVESILEGFLWSEKACDCVGYSIRVNKTRLIR